MYLSLCLSVSLYLSPSVCLSVYLSICPSVHLSICLSICLSVHLSICPSVHLSICLSVYLSIYLSIYLFVCLSTYRSIYLSNYPSNARLHVATSFAAQRRALFRHLHLQKWSQRRVLFHNSVRLQMCFVPQQRALFSPPQLPKVLRAWCAVSILTAKYASRHNVVKWTSTSVPNAQCFTFGLPNAPRRHAFFEHLNVQKRS